MKKIRELKKSLRTAAVVTAIPVLLCACAVNVQTDGAERGALRQTDEAQADEGGAVQQTDEAQADKGGVVREQDANVEPGNPGAKGGSSVEKTNEKNNSVINLTANNNTITCIDYAIKDYAPLREFCYALFGENTDRENPVLSPVSAYLALSMVGMGAGGNTEAEFRSVLGEEDMTVFADDMMNTLPADTADMTLAIANSAWISDSFDVNEEWVGSIKSFLDAEAFQTNISSDAAMRGINDWVERNTNGLIQEMLEEPLDAMTRLALFNTVYFKAKWTVPFETVDTHIEDFTLADGSVVETDMMNQHEKELQYIANDFSEGVVLPYRESDLALVALKPTGQDDVRTVYEKLTNEVIHETLNGIQTETVNLKLPKFEITFDHVLNDSLQQMGLRDAFDGEKADFDRLGQSEDNIYISLVRQKAKIIVDEEGTEAAAATEVVLREMALEWPEHEPKDVYFNEPFLYIIMDMEKEIPLFIGIIDNPTV
ncbi:MAG: serpin family protein [Roseburia sp.]|nr:serpin family protein [Roseburia sp.]